MALQPERIQIPRSLAADAYYENPPEDTTTVEEKPEPPVAPYAQTTGRSFISPVVPVGSSTLAPATSPLAAAPAAPAPVVVTAAPAPAPVPAPTLAPTPAPAPAPAAVTPAPETPEATATEAKPETKPPSSLPTAEEAYQRLQALRIANEARKAKKEAELEAEKEKLAKEEATVQQNRITAAERAELERGRMVAPKFKEMPYKEPEKTNVAQQWGSAAMVIAMLASAFTRNRAVTALNAATGVMKGFQEGDKANAEEAYQKWKVANDNMLKAFNYELEAYKDAMKGIDSREKLEELRGTAREKEILAKVKALDAAFNNDTNRMIAEEKRLEGVFTHVKSMEKVDTQIRKTSDEIDKKVLVAQVMQSPEYEEADAETKLKMTAATGDQKSVDAYRAYLRSKQAVDKENTTKLQEIQKTDEYKNASALQKLEMRAPFDKNAAKELDKMLEKEVQVSKADMSAESEDQHKVDMAIANYQMEPPKQPYSKNPVAQEIYRRQMARILAINPDFDQTKYRSRGVIEQHWLDPNGQGGKQVLSMNTSASHLADFESLLDAMETGNITLFNTIRRNMKAGIGRPDIIVNDVNAARRVVADEITKSVIGSAGALADREEMQKLLNPNQPIDVLKNNVKTLRALQGGRLENLQKLYKNGTRRSDKDFNELMGDEVIVNYPSYLGASKEEIDAAKARMAARGRTDLGTATVEELKKKQEQKGGAPKPGGGVETQIIKQGGKTYRVQMKNGVPDPSTAVEITEGK